MSDAGPDPFPPALRAHLQTPGLAPLWALLRSRLERSGHAIRGAVEVEVDDEAADHLAGLLGRPVPLGRVRITLAELDASLRASAAGRGLVATVAALSGRPLRDRPAERAASHEDWARVWQGLNDDLGEADLARGAWTGAWIQWLHASGVVTRLGAAPAAAILHTVVAALADIAPALTADLDVPARSLGELASRVTGDAHGLDDGRPTSALLLRAAAIALDWPLPTSATERRALWARIGIESDRVSGTVLVWALRPPGADRWSRMMRERADLGLVTHLTLDELRRTDAPAVEDGTAVHACENPQVLQALAGAGVDRPLACLYGNPSAAGAQFARRVTLCYHGDFDWPGIAIARRLYASGAIPWRMSVGDYVHAAAAQPGSRRLALTGRPEPTPWDESLGSAMIRIGVAVHEESMIATLLTDLRRS